MKTSLSSPPCQRMLLEELDLQCSARLDRQRPPPEQQVTTVHSEQLVQVIHLFTVVTDWSVEV
jgi:hypothetical protein